MSSQHKHKLPLDFLSFSETLKVLPTIPEVEGTSTTGNSSDPFCHNNSTLFSNAREFSVKNSHFYSAPGASFQIFTEGLSQNAGNLDFLGFPVCEDVELEGQLHKSGEYHLHRGRLRGRAVVVKVFKGPRAKQLCLKTAELNRGIMHSNVLRLIGGPDRNLGSSFLVFDGGNIFTEPLNRNFEGCKGSLCCWCKHGHRLFGGLEVERSLNQLGLDYLQDLGLPLSLMGPEHFLLMLSKQNRMVLSFDPDVTWDATNRNNGSDRTATEICNELIQRTFYTSCKKYYQDQRLYDDDFDNGFDNEDDEPEGNLVNGSRQGDAPVRDSASPSGAGSSRKPSKGHRQELVWKPHSTTSTPSSLGEIGRHYQLSLTRFQSEDNVLVHRQGHSTMRTAHRCLGYKRTEIILAPHIERSSIVSHTSPLPNEICSVCGENVGKLAQLEAFDLRSFMQANGLTPVLSGRRPSAMSISSLHRPHFPFKLDLSSPSLRISEEEIDFFNGIASPVTLVPKSAPPTGPNDFSPDFMVALGNDPAQLDPTHSAIDISPHKPHGIVPPKDLGYVKKKKMRGLFPDAGAAGTMTGIGSGLTGSPTLQSFWDLSQAELPEVEREAERQLRPFACGVGECIRRYKTINGLRYHYKHSGEHGAVGLALLASGQHECLRQSARIPMSRPLTAVSPYRVDGGRGQRARSSRKRGQNDTEGLDRFDSTAFYQSLSSPASPPRAGSSALSPSNLQQWNGNGDSQPFGTKSDPTLFGNPRGSYTAGLDRHGASDSNADKSGGLGSLSTTPPSATFTAVGLPFRGLDYIRNYNPSEYGTADQDSLWQVYDPAGAMGYDPDLPFTLGGASGELWETNHYF